MNEPNYIVTLLEPKGTHENVVVRKHDYDLNTRAGVEKFLSVWKNSVILFYKELEG